MLILILATVLIDASLLAYVAVTPSTPPAEVSIAPAAPAHKQ